MKMLILSSEEIGRKIRAYRQASGLSQEKLAELVDVTFQQIQKYESGATRLNTDKLQKVATALGIPAVELLSKGVVTGVAGLTSEEQRLVRGFQSIQSSEARRHVVALVEHLAYPGAKSGKKENKK
jgi:transcriptional regulator with XRE-family HTH domain